MRFNDHSKLVGLHAFLSPSKPHWSNYSDDKFDRAYRTHMAAVRGTELHEFAKDAIRLGVKLRGNNTTMAMYVNDGIGFGLTPEVPLVYSEHAFGTADTIGFKKNFLRIHDLKTGITPTSFRQLEIYVAYFCLEYNYNPKDIGIELRIYQSDEIKVHVPDPEVIQRIMDNIVKFDAMIRDIRKEVE